MAQASVIPYQGELNEEMSHLFEALELHNKTSERDALAIAHSLYVEAENSSKNVEGWALNIYAEFLLSNDSIKKAEELLLDSSAGRWADAEDWIKDYHTLNLGSAAGFNGRYTEAEKYFKEVLIRSQNDLLKSRAMQALAENLRYQGKLDQSLVRWYESLSLSEFLEDSSDIVDAYLGRGIVRFLRDELQEAEYDIKIYYQYNTRLGNEKKVAYGLSLMGLLDYQNRKYEQSIERNLEGYNIRKRINDLKGQGESLNNLALGYMGLKNWNQALKYLEQAAQLKTQANDLTQMTVILNNMGHCHNQLGRASEALKYFNLALAKGKENGQMGDVVNSYRNIIKTQTSSSDYAAALKSQTELLVLKDSLAEAKRTEAIQELEVKYETEKKEQEITLLQQDKSIITNRWLTLALGLFLTIIIGVLFIDNQKRKHRQEKQLLLTEDELQKAELKNLADELDFNRNKLSLYTENLLKKNELVSQLETRLKDTVDLANTKSEEGKQLIEDFSAVRILTDEDWTEFKTLFNRVHEGLLDRLLFSYEGLTLGEQRLFLLMKLGLSTKEIANILGVSPESIKKGRYRLKKKLQMDESTTLQDFVNSF